MMLTRKVATHRAMFASAFMLLSQVAAGAAFGEPEVIVVTAPRVETEARGSRLDVDVAALIDAVNKRIAADLARDVKAITAPRIELATLEARTRG